MPDPGLTSASTTRILVIVVNYLCESEVAAFVYRTLAQRFSGTLTVMVVDNSPSPGRHPPLKELQAEDQRVELVTANRNLGYFGGARLALEHYLTSRSVPDWVIVSNPDIFFTDATFFASLDNLYKDQRPALVVPAIAGATGSDFTQLMRWRPTSVRMHFYKWVFGHPVTSLGYHALSRTKRALKQFQALVLQRARSGGRRVGPPQSIYAPHGSFLVFSRRYFDEGGTLNHGAFLFGEELFVAETARRLGLPILHDPRLAVVHRGKVTTDVFRNPQVLRYLKEASAYVADGFFAD